MIVDANRLKRFLVWMGMVLSVSPLLAQRDLQQLPDPDPQVQLATFTVPDGMTANLFAGDGQIAKPIHMNFDARGRLWVAGSEVYPHIEPGQAATDKIFILEDSTGDGIADQVTVFADNLLIPTGILPDERGGCYVANSTELLYLWDSDGDGKADQRRIVLSGFGTEDTHHLLHTLTWAPDGSMFMNQSIYIHSHVETPYGVQRMNGGGVWRFRPDTLHLEVHCLGFVNPWGKIFDAWGQSFATDGAYGEGINYVFPNSVFVTSPGVTRIVGGMNPGSPKHCGLELVSGRHFPESWQGNMITNDFRANRVCRFEVEPQGSAYRSRQLPEVIRSTHQAFRPIDAKMGADGALYIADWYNPIIQHGEVDFRDPRRDRQRGRIWRLSFPDRPLVQRDDLGSLSPVQLLEQLRLPEQSTRIWAKRMLRHHALAEVQEAIRQAAMAHTATADVSDWNAFSQHQNFLLELLWAGLNVDWLNRPLLDELLRSPHERARAAAVRIASDFLFRQEPQDLRDILTRAIQDDHPQVRLEALCALRRLEEASSATIALRALDRPVDATMDFALWKTLRDLANRWVPLAETGQFDFGDDPVALAYALKAVGSADVVEPLLQLLESGQVATGTVPSVLRQIASLATQEQFDRTVEWILKSKQDVALDRLLVLGTETTRVPAAIPEVLLEKLLELQSMNLDEGASLKQAEAYLRLAAQWSTPPSTEILFSIAQQEEPSRQPIVEASLRAIANMIVIAGEQGEGVKQRYFELLRNTADRRRQAILWGQIARWDLKRAVVESAPLLTTLESEALVPELLGVLLQQQGGQKMLADTMEESQLSIRPNIAREAIRLVRSSAAPEPRLIAALQQAGQLNASGWKLTDDQRASLLQRVGTHGDPHAGERIYRRADLQCLNCHAIGGVGSVVGPDMISIGASAPVDYLLESLLEPSAKIKEGYHSKKILTIDGLILTGMVQSHADRLYRLRLADGSLRTVPEDDIDEIADGPSLMPDGLVDTLTEQELIDLVSFMSQLGRAEEFSIRTENIVRGWQTLSWDRDTHRLLNRTSYDSAADGRQGLPWQTFQPLVSGAILISELPTYQIHANVPPTSFLRTEMQVVESGKIEIHFSSINGVQMWLDGKPTPLTQPRLALELAAGRHEAVFAINREAASPQLQVKVEADPAGKAVIKLPLQWSGSGSSLAQE